MAFRTLLDEFDLVPREVAKLQEDESNALAQSEAIAMNAAAQLATSSEAGRILIADTTYELLKDEIPYELRGGISGERHQPPPHDLLGFVTIANFLRPGVVRLLRLRSVTL